MAWRPAAIALALSTHAEISRNQRSTSPADVAPTATPTAAQARIRHFRDAQWVGTAVAAIHGELDTGRDVNAALSCPGDPERRAHVRAGRSRSGGSPSGRGGARRPCAGAGQGAPELGARLVRGREVAESRAVAAVDVVEAHAAAAGAEALEQVIDSFVVADARALGFRRRRRHHGVSVACGAVRPR